LPELRAVLFDFDYTLADSSTAVVECCNAALKGIGLLPAQPERIHRTIGLSLPDTLARLAGEEHRHRAEEFRRIWRGRSDAVMLEKTTLYSETHQVVATLQSLGMSLGIVSTKWRKRILAVLEREELVDPFPVIVGGDDVTEHKPDPEGLLEAMRLLDVSPEQTAYVGDSPTDAHAAQRAGTSFVAVLSGVTKTHEFDEFSALGILQNVGGISAGLLARADTIRV